MRFWRGTTEGLIIDPARGRFRHNVVDEVRAQLRGGADATNLGPARAARAADHAHALGPDVADAEDRDVDAAAFIGTANLDLAEEIATERRVLREEVAHLDDLDRPVPSHHARGSRRPILHFATPPWRCRSSHASTAARSKRRYFTPTLRLGSSPRAAAE